MESFPKLGHKNFSGCNSCETEPAFPTHILGFSIFITYKVLYNPILYNSFLEILGFMELI